jgi:hypothetical protein
MKTVPLLAVDCPDVRELLREADVIELGSSSTSHYLVQLRSQQSDSPIEPLGEVNDLKTIRIVGNPDDPKELALARAAEERYRRRPR